MTRHSSSVAPEDRAQDEVCRFLESLSGASDPAPKRIETHISRVFLYANRVLKLKKAVRLPYLDFSDPEVRLLYCKRELTLNRRTAPQIYKSVLCIIRMADMSLALVPAGSEQVKAGKLVDAVVEMARFEQDQVLDNVAAHGPLEKGLLDRLAHAIASFHSTAEVKQDASGFSSIMRAQEANEAGFASTGLAQHPAVKTLLRDCKDAIVRYTGILDERGRTGRIRRCHGDLHLRNICLFDGVPVLFDCLEFDEDLASIDVLYDLAFLLMDLWHRRQEDAANYVFNRYLDETADSGSLIIMPVLMALRAAVRGHIAASRAEALPANESGAAGAQVQAQEAQAQEAQAQEAQAYINMANAILTSDVPQLVAVGGLSGSGKSTAATAFAPNFGPAPGARVLSTDRIRKALFHVSPLQRLPQEAYAKAVSTQVYETQRQEALQTLRGGWSVVVDGVFLREDERKAIAAIAAEANVPFTGIWLETPPDRLAQRIHDRRNDPSDATADVLEAQMEHFREEPPPQQSGWIRIDSTHTVAATAEAISEAVGHGSR